MSGNDYNTPQQDNKRRKTDNDSFIVVDTHLDRNEISNHTSQNNNTTLLTEGDIIKCPYIDTVNRHLLDFDLEKVCNISLSDNNIYCCLICGIYLQGKNNSSPAYQHSLDKDHSLFINLHDSKIFCLPDNYEVTDPSLNDIKKFLFPTFTKDQIDQLYNTQEPLGLTIDDEEFYPGLVGLNDLGRTGWLNSTIHILNSLIPLRTEMLLFNPKNHSNNSENISENRQLHSKNFESINITDKVFLQMSNLLRKMWWPRAFRTHVSPFETLLAIENASDDKYTFNKNIDICQFLVYILNSLHKTYLEGKVLKIEKNIKNSKISPISQSVQGHMRLCSGEVEHILSGDIPSMNCPFMVLPLRLPPMDVFVENQRVDNSATTYEQQKKNQRLLLSKVDLHSLLNKFNGFELSNPTALKPAKLPETQPKTNDHNEKKLKKNKFQPWYSRSMSLSSLPNYVVFTYPRLSLTQFSSDWNEMLVNFPTNDLDLFKYTPDSRENGHFKKAHPLDDLFNEEISHLNVSEIKENAKKWITAWEDMTSNTVTKNEVEENRFKILSNEFHNSLEKSECVDNYRKISKCVYERHRSRYTYRLITHAVETRLIDASKQVKDGKHVCFIRHSNNNKWYLLENLNIKTDETTELEMSISPPIVQVYEKNYY